MLVLVRRYPCSNVFFRINKYDWIRHEKRKVVSDITWDWVNLSPLGTLDVDTVSCPPSDTSRLIARVRIFQPIPSTSVMPLVMPVCACRKKEFMIVQHPWRNHLKKDETEQSHVCILRIHFRASCFAIAFFNSANLFRFPSLNKRLISDFCHLHWNGRTMKLRSQTMNPNNSQRF